MRPRVRPPGVKVWPFSSTPNQRPNSSAFASARQTRSRGALNRTLRSMRSVSEGDAEAVIAGSHRATISLRFEGCPKTLVSATFWLHDGTCRPAPADRRRSADAAHRLRRVQRAHGLDRVGVLRLLVGAVA